MNFKEWFQEQEKNEGLLSRWAGMIAIPLAAFLSGCNNQSCVSPPVTQGGREVELVQSKESAGDEAIWQEVQESKDHIFWHPDTGVIYVAGMVDVDVNEIKRDFRSREIAIKKAELNASRNYLKVTGNTQAKVQNLGMLGQPRINVKSGQLIVVLMLKKNENSSPAIGSSPNIGSSKTIQSRDPARLP